LNKIENGYSLNNRNVSIFKMFHLIIFIIKLYKSVANAPKIQMIILKFLDKNLQISYDYRNICVCKILLQSYRTIADKPTKLNLQKLAKFEAEWDRSDQLQSCHTPSTSQHL